MPSLTEFNALLGLRDFPFTYQEYAASIHDAFNDPTTIVFLDTNVLAVPFRMPSEARKGFYKILEKPIQENRLFVPGWVSNEYFFNALKSDSNRRHGFSSDVTSSIGNIPTSDVVRNFVAEAASAQEISQLARALGVPEESALQELGRSFEKCSNLLATIGKDRDPQAVHEELLALLEDRCLDLDFEEHLVRLEEQSDRRRANRIPPGLTDDKKGDERRGAKAGNIDGDLAVWLEVIDRTKTIERVKAEPYSRTIVLCEEKKADFVYAPIRRKLELGGSGGRPRLVPNTKPEITLIDPRLVSEFSAKVGHRNIAFVRIEHIASGLSAAEEGDVEPEVRAFILAYQKQAATTARQDSPESIANEAENSQDDRTLTHSAETASENASRESNATHSDGSTQSTATRLSIPQSARDDEKEYASNVMEDPFKRIAGDLYSHNWYVQNPAVIQLIQVGLPADLGASFILGRAVLQAADGSAWRADKFLNDFDGWADERTECSQAFLAGAAYECCFTGSGEVRDNFKTDYLPLILELLASSKWDLAKNDFIEQVSNIRERFQWLPDRPLPRVTLVVTTATVGERIEAAGLRLTIDDQPGRDLLVSRAFSASANVSFDIDRVVRTISEELLLPRSSINVEYANPQHTDEIFYPIDRSFSIT